METHAAARSRRDARILQNLSLRRRCMFLMDREMWLVCILGVSGDVAATSANATQLRSSTVALLKTHSRQLENITEAGVEDVQAALAGMTAALTSTSSWVFSDTEAASAPTSTAAVSLSSATCSTAGENRCWDEWEEALETLLTFLEEPHDATSAPSTTSCVETRTRDSNEGGGCAVASRETDLERVVRTLLCELVLHFYETGRAYYAAKREAKRAAAGCGKRSRDAPADGRKTGRCEMRVTWSVAAPIAPLLYDLYKR
ncbi:hypothetical protein GH5_05354 [Leishmania sp. Ghana 2012 LV757]|uniref:hypothetical protein n=1 Tax=Leishmania sp. Ghana 2012 LV757 TaxID=2803181 RepID=UPI001B75BB96|nr:hypothetical protein GH5_05354 [Leishmania sp. Ghana 2012 LV757]